MFTIHNNHLISSLELPNNTTVFTVRHIDNRIILKDDCESIPAAKQYIDTLTDGE